MPRNVFLPCFSVRVKFLVIVAFVFVVVTVVVVRASEVVALIIGTCVVGMGLSETFAVNVFEVLLKLIVNCTFVIFGLSGIKQTVIQPVLYMTIVETTSEPALNCISYFTKQMPESS